MQISVDVVYGPNAGRKPFSPEVFDILSHEFSDNRHAAEILPDRPERLLVKPAKYSKWTFKVNAPKATPIRC